MIYSGWLESAPLTRNPNAHGPTTIYDASLHANFLSFFLCPLLLLLPTRLGSRVECVERERGHRQCYLRGPPFADVSPNENSVTGLGSLLLLLPSSFLSLWKPNYFSNFVYYDDWFKLKMAEIVLPFVSLHVQLRRENEKNHSLMAILSRYGPFSRLPPAARCKHSSPKRTTQSCFSGYFCLFLSQNTRYPLECVCVCRLAFFQLPSVLSISRLSSTTTTFTVHRRSRFQSKEENKLFPTSEESIKFLTSALKTIITTPSAIVKNHKFYFMKWNGVANKQFFLMKFSFFFVSLFFLDG